MSERLSDEMVAHIEATCMEWGWPEFVSLAREVQEWRSTYIDSGDDLRDFLRATDVTQTIDALCIRHGITVEGIVALVDEVMTTFAPYPYNATSDRAHLRRLARGEEA